MKKKERRLLTKIILCGLGAIAWTADCAETLSCGRPGFLQFVAAAVFIAAFIITLRRYLNSRAEEAEA